MTRVSVIGTGYVGLVSGACLAEAGHQVTCVDVDAAKVSRINAGDPPIFELGLPELLGRNVGQRLTATTDLRAAVMDSELTFIAVGTPASDGRIDLQYVERAAGEIGQAMAGKADYHVVVVKSTVIPGTTDGVVRGALERGSGGKAGDDFGLGMNPEFLTEGQAIDDFMHPDRLVLGGMDDRTHAMLCELYGGFDGVPRIMTNNATAEMIKYASNATLATMISLANEYGRVCSALGNVDVVDVMRGVHASAYFTTRHEDGATTVAPITSFLESGCGFGGSCLPKDVTALVAAGHAMGVEMPVLRAVLEVNAEQPKEVLRLVRRHFADLRNVPVTVLGLAFKPDTDDLRESPAFPVIGLLRDAGARVTAFDPVADAAGHSGLGGVVIAESLEQALLGADAVVIVTRWKEFGEVPGILERLGRNPLLVDGRRMVPADSYARYEGIGR